MLGWVLLVASMVQVMPFSLTFLFPHEENGCGITGIDGTSTVTFEREYRVASELAPIAYLVVPTIAQTINRVCHFVASGFNWY